MINVDLLEKDYERFLTLVASGVFDIKNGKAILNFDSEGTLCEVECNIKLYKRGVPLVSKLHFL